MNHNIDGYWDPWLKVENEHVLIKNAENFFQLSFHVDKNPSQEISKDVEDSKPSIFIHNQDNLLEIVGIGPSMNETSEQLENNELSNSSYVINENGQDTNDRNDIFISEEIQKKVWEIFNSNTTTDLVDDGIKCKNEFGICEEIPDYPSYLLEKELDANPAFRYLEVNETDKEISVVIGNRFGEPDFQPLCHSMRQYLRPKSARTELDELLFVVNNENFVQIIEVEICNNHQKTCDFSENFPAGYTSVCEQKYVNRKLLAIDSSKKLSPKIFKIPAGCCCGVKFNDGF
ncbi:uncharacterized protein [Chelonus insularis]|uniref:uncharacterized protein n=1 Tax=Chelonus insularis TaxID=460826 RepID=UPI00158EB2E4|nr:uncharacterized protein LOC118069702 [Chelonus insularis]